VSASDRAKRFMANWRRQGLTEQVTYRPSRDGLEPREITALIDRPGADGILSGAAPGFHVTALNDPDDGIPSDPALSDAGSDRIDLAERVGGTATPRALRRFAAQDADFVTVEVL